MTTKEQERKALEQIKKIVAGLGENSYVATALEGCFEIAEENIEYDMACSMKQRYEAAVKNEEYFHNIANEEAREVEKLEEKIEELKDEIYCLKNTVHDLETQKHDAETQAIDERKDVTVGTADGQKDTTSFARVQFYNNDGFKFINVVQKSGWTTSYKIDDLTTLVIE